MASTTSAPVLHAHHRATARRTPGRAPLHLSRHARSARASAARAQRSEPGRRPTEGSSHDATDVSTTQATLGDSSDEDARDRGVTFSYHSDGHFKATLEDVFGRAGPLQVEQGSAPWNLGWQTNERNVMWSDGLKSRLIVKVAAQAEGETEAGVERKVQELLPLLPQLGSRLSCMKPKTLLRLANNRNAVAEHLLVLKAVFPRADCGKMLVQELGLLGESEEGLRERAACLREFLPSTDIDALVQENPCILSVDSFKAAVDDARRLMPSLNIERMLESEPDFILSLQKGTDMIPYDAVPDNPWGHK